MRALRYASSIPIGYLVVLTACLDSSTVAPEPFLTTTTAFSVIVDCDDRDDIADRIDALEDAGAINAGQAAALRAMLAQARRGEDQGRPDKVAAAYARLLDQIDVFTGGSLSEEDAAALAACVADVADGPDPDLLFVQVAGGLATPAA